MRSGGCRTPTTRFAIETPQPARAGLMLVPQQRLYYAAVLLGIVVAVGTGGSPWVGHSVRDASLREPANALILAVRFEDGDYALNPSPDLVIEDGMGLFLLAEHEKLAGLP